jgi:endonuclease YncB( thermonuclease family)
MSLQKDIESISHKFTEFNYNSTPHFTLNGKKMYGRVVSVYDGDTITIVLNIFNDFYKFNVRLSGIDTCEVKSKNEKNKELACFARSRLISLITNKDISETIVLKDRRMINNFLSKNVYCVWVECLDFDKYGRLLANICSHENSENFSSMLIKEKLAYKYEGNTKLTEEEQLDSLKCTN